MTRRYCSECGKAGATLRQRDCANQVHWFHSKCLREFAAWVRGERKIEAATGTSSAAPR